VVYGDCSQAGDTDDTRAGGDAGFDGRSQGEAASENGTDIRLQHAQAGLLRTVGGPAGGAAASALGTLYLLGSRATAIGSDLTNQMGVGHMSYHPDLSRDRSHRGSGTADASDPGHEDPNERPDQGLPADPGPAVTSGDTGPAGTSTVLDE
jgi:type IV secretion system protein TrbL